MLLAVVVVGVHVVVAHVVVVVVGVVADTADFVVDVVVELEDVLIEGNQLLKGVHVFVCLHLAAVIVLGTVNTVAHVICVAIVANSVAIV